MGPVFKKGEGFVQMYINLVFGKIFLIWGDPTGMNVNIIVGNAKPEYRRQGLHRF